MKITLVPAAGSARAKTAAEARADGMRMIAQIRHRSSGCFNSLARPVLPSITRPNVHLVLGSGESVKIDATEAQLEGADSLYRAVTLNVRVKEHLRTGEILKARLIGGVKPLREVDEDKLKTLWKKGKKAWAGVSSPTEWVEHLRES